MKTIGLMIAGMLCTTLFAQQPPMPVGAPQPEDREQKAETPGRIGRGVGGGRSERSGEMLLFRLLNNREIMDGLGISEATAKKIESENKAINAKLSTQRTRIDELSAKQVELAKEIISTPGEDPKPLMDIIEEIGQLRIKAAQCMTRRMLVLRDNLTQEQMKALKERLDEQRRIRREQQKLIPTPPPPVGIEPPAGPRVRGNEPRGRSNHERILELLPPVPQ